MTDQPLIDISPENWRIVRDILQRHLPDREVWAFGSRAKWTAKEYSDLDIAVIGDEPLSIGVMAKLNEAFQESALPFKVDVVDLAGITPSFRKVIEAGKVLVQKRTFTSTKIGAGFDATEMLGESAIPSGWTIGLVSEFAEINKESITKKNQPTRIEYLDISSVGTRNAGQATAMSFADAPSRARRVVKSGDTLIATVRPNLKSYVFISNASPRLVASTGFAVISPKKIKDARWLHYFLTSDIFNEYLVRMADGGAYPAFNPNLIAESQILVPPSRVREDIGNFLGALDDKIDLLRETNATLEAIAQALFKSWFVDFDPVRATAEGREPEGVPPEIAELFPSEFEDSEIGEIPKGWTVEPFGKLLGHAIGGDWGKDDADDEHSTAVAIVRGTDIPDIKVGNLDGVPRRFVSPKKLKSRRLQDGDLIIEVSGGSKTQATGRSLYCTDGLLDDFGTPVVPASFCRLFRPADKHLGILLAIHLSSIYAAGKMWNYQVQSTGLANFQTTHFLESELVVVPSEPIREAFFDCVRPLIERQQMADIRTTALLRDSLLPRLLNGALKV